MDYNIFKNPAILCVDNQKIAVQITDFMAEYGEPTRFRGVMIPGVFDVSNKLARVNGRPGIEKVIFNPPCTIVIWSDKSKTIVKCQPGDVYDAEKGLALCISKKYFNNQGNFNEVFKKHIPKTENIKKVERVSLDDVHLGDIIRVTDTKDGCLGAEGKIGKLTLKPHTSGLLAKDEGFNIECGRFEIWRVNKDVSIEIIERAPTQPLSVASEEWQRLKSELERIVEEGYKHGYATDIGTETYGRHMAYADILTKMEYLERGY